MARPKPAHPPSDDWGGPYVGMAFFCGDLEVDENGTPSFRRVGDRITLSTPGQTEVLKLVIGVRAGTRTGAASCRIGVLRPAGAYNDEVIALAKDYQSGDGITAWQFQLEFVTDVSGTFWFDVRINNQLVTRLPLTVVITEQPGEA